jgi:hypothetical protein
MSVPGAAVRVFAPHTPIGAVLFQGFGLQAVTAFMSRQRDSVDIFSRSA